MERLGPSDYEAVLTFVHELYAVDRIDALPGQAIEGIGRLIPSDMLTYNEIDPRRQIVVRRKTHEGEITAHQVAALERNTHQHPLIARYPITGDSTPLKISDFLTLSQFRRLDTYNQFFGEMGINYRMAVTIRSSPALVIRVALNRRGRDFSERDRALLNLVRPHLAQAHRLVGERALLLERAERAERSLWSTPGRDLAVLTRREHEILELVADGKTNPQIGDRLRVSSRTVQKHLEHVYDKLGVRSRTAAAIKLGR